VLEVMLTLYLRPAAQAALWDRGIAKDNVVEAVEVRCVALGAHVCTLLLPNVLYHVRMYVCVAAVLKGASSGLSWAKSTRTLTCRYTTRNAAPHSTRIDTSMRTGS
jgi:hypothetical protein